MQPLNRSRNPVSRGFYFMPVPKPVLNDPYKTCAQMSLATNRKGGLDAQTIESSILASSFRAS